MAEVPQLSRMKNKDREWYEEQLDRYGQKILPLVPIPARTDVPDDCVLHLPLALPLPRLC